MIIKHLIRALHQVLADADSGHIKIVVCTHFCITVMPFLPTLSMFCVHLDSPYNICSILPLMLLTPLCAQLCLVLLLGILVALLLFID